MKYLKNTCIQRSEQLLLKWKYIPYQLSHFAVIARYTFVVILLFVFNTSGLALKVKPNVPI